MRIAAAWLLCLTVCGIGFCGDLPARDCRQDADCLSLGEGYKCTTQKTGCPDNPSMSTCASSVCAKAEPPASTPAVADGPNPIQLRYRTCRTDDDCAVVVVGCHCMYCARPDDLKDGWVQGVNKKFAKEFERLSKCSDADRRKCATAGACAVTGESLPACKQRRCTVVYKARS